MTIVRPIKTVDDLGEAGLVGDRDRDRAALEEVAARYAIALTPTVSRLIDRTDPDDPIARQFVPDAAELLVTPEERADPIGDEPGIGELVHRLDRPIDRHCPYSATGAHST